MLMKIDAAGRRDDVERAKNSASDIRDVDLLVSKSGTSFMEGRSSNDKTNKLTVSETMDDQGRVPSGD